MEIIKECNKKFIKVYYNDKILDLLVDYYGNEDKWRENIYAVYKSKNLTNDRQEFTWYGCNILFDQNKKISKIITKQTNYLNKYDSGSDEEFEYKWRKQLGIE